MRPQTPRESVTRLALGRPSFEEEPTAIRPAPKTASMQCSLHCMSSHVADG